MIEPFFSTSGKHIGYKIENGLYSAHGKKIGQFVDNEVFDRHGKYRGELHLERLSRNTHKKMKRSQAFIPSRQQPRPHLPRMNAIPIPPQYHHFYHE
jgi:hypothetical protein